MGAEGGGDGDDNKESVDGGSEDDNADREKADAG